MNIKVHFNLKVKVIAYSFLVISIISVGLFTTNTFAEGEQPTPNPTTKSLISTQDALATQVETISNELDIVNRKIDLAKEEAEFTVEKILLEKWKPFFIATLLASLLFTILGISGFYQIKQTLDKKIREKLENELYQLDPTFLSIYLPDKDFERELERIKLSGLKNIRTYHTLEKRLLNGVVIIPIRNEEDKIMYLEFIKEYKPKPDQVAFILYSRGKAFKIDEETLMKHNNTTVATNPTALARAILDVGRGLRSV